MDALTALISATVSLYVSPNAQVIEIQPIEMAPHERGWSGAEIRRYRVRLSTGASLMLLTKTMHRKERCVLHELSQQGHANVPFAFAEDLTSDTSVLTCMQDLGAARVGIPSAEDSTPTSPELDQQVAQALAAIHARNLGRTDLTGWLPNADPTYVTDFLVKAVWRDNWEQSLASNATFAREFARYTPALEKAGAQLAKSMQSLWAEGNALTVTHGEVHGEHIMLHQGRPYFIDWGWTYYGPLYLDLPAYFTPHTVHHYWRALNEHGVRISELDFMARYREIGRYVGFKYLCSGMWIWPPGPTEVTGRRILMLIQWAIDGTWPERAFAVSPVAWQKLLAEHQQRLHLSDTDA